MIDSHLSSPIHIEGTINKGVRAVFLDRDGVINEDIDYVGTWDRFKFLEGSIEGIKLLNYLGYRIIIVTNQSGIGRGYYSVEDFRKLTTQMLDELSRKGANIDAVFACPHYYSVEKKSCDCRKPKPGMISMAIKKYNLSTKLSYLVGDKISDIESANAAGIYQTALISKALIDKKKDKPKEKWQVTSLIEFALILKELVKK